MNALVAKKLSGRGLQPPLHVLVLDDDAFDRKRVRRWIERNSSVGVELTEAASLADFQHCLSHGQFDLVFLDYGLADGTGLEAAAVLRGHPDQAQSYTVMISGRDEACLQDLCLRAGCDQFLSKGALDAAQVGQLVAAARRRKWPADLRSGGTRRSALEYWRLQAELRAWHLHAGHQTGNLEVLRDRLGIELEPVSGTEKPAKQVLKPFVLNEAMSAALRLFIADFLLCDEFDFVAAVGAPQPPPLDLPR